MLNICTSVFRLSHHIVRNSSYQAFNLLMLIWITIRFSKTDWLSATKLSLKIEEAYAYTSVLLSSLHLIRSIIGMDAELNDDFSRNAAKKAWNPCNQTYCYQTSVPCLYTFSTSIQRSIISLLAFYIYFFRPVAGIFHPDLIYKAIVTDLNLKISPILHRQRFFYI